MNSLHQVALQGWIALAWLMGPAILLGFAIGLGVSLLQAVTQVQDSSLGFAPKLMGLVLLFAIGGAAMFHGVTHYATVLYQSIPVLVQHG